MASILSSEQQRTAGSAARKAGGYEEIIRLERERRAADGKGEVRRDARSGRLIFERSNSAPSAKK